MISKKEKKATSATINVSTTIMIISETMIVYLI